jgi:sulfoacetaldehyde dehydrogenase
MEAQRTRGKKMETGIDEGLDSFGVVAGLICRAREAMENVSAFDQAEVNEVVQAVAWANIERERAEELARIAVQDTGLGNAEDKSNKNQRKTLGTLRDLLDPSAKSVGVVSVDEEKGITAIAKPIRRPTRGASTSPTPGASARAPRTWQESGN